MPIMDDASWSKLMGLALRTLPVSADAGDVIMAGTIFDVKKPAFSVYGNRIIMRDEVQGDEEILRQLGISPEGL